MVTKLMLHIPTITPFSLKQWESSFIAVKKFHDIVSVNSTEYTNKVDMLFGQIKQDVYDKWIRRLKGSNDATQNSESNIASSAIKPTAINTASATTTSKRKRNTATTTETRQILEEDENECAKTTKKRRTRSLTTATNN